MTEEQPHVPPEPGAPAPSHADHAGPAAEAQDAAAGTAHAAAGTAHAGAGTAQAAAGTAQAASGHADDHGGPVHGTADHGDDGGHDDHGHAEEPLGPIDVAAWGAGALGIAIAAVTVLCFALATGAIGAAV